MNTFRYKAVDQHGRLRRSQFAAANVADLESQLKHMGLDLIQCRPVKPRTLRRSGGLRRRDLIDFCFQLEQLTSAGVALLESLAEMGSSPSRFSEVLLTIRGRIEAGKTLSGALAEHPDTFDAVFIGVVRVGEESGELPAVLRSLGETLRWQDELVATAKKAMAYPLFVAVVVGALVIFLMIYLVPELVRFVDSMEGNLPLQTRLLLETSAVVREFWHWMLAAPLVLWFALNTARLHSPDFRLLLDRLVLKIPLLGDIMLKTILARTVRILALMYEAGVPVLRSVEATGETVGNRAVEAALQSTRQQIAEGGSMGESFAASGMFPPLLIRMIKVGENTGALGDALLNVAYFYDRDVREKVSHLEAVLEPALTIFLGLTLGWVMLATLGPVYELVTRMQ